MGAISLTLGAGLHKETHGIPLHCQGRAPYASVNTYALGKLTFSYHREDRLRLRHPRGPGST